MNNNEAILNALEVGLCAAEQVAAELHTSLKGYLQHKHDAVDEGVAEIKAAIALLDASTEQAPDAEQGGTCAAIDPPDLPRLPSMYFPSEQALWDYAVLTGWRVAHFAEQGVGMARQVPVAWLITVLYKGRGASTTIASLEPYVEMIDADCKLISQEPLFAAPLPPAAIKKPVELDITSVDGLLFELDTISQQYDNYEYGIPMHDDPVREQLRDAVQVFVLSAKVAAIPPATNESAGGLDSLWISVAERLPETFITDDTPCVLAGKSIGPLINSENVLISTSDGNVYVDRLEGIHGSGEPYWANFGKRVTHWMQKPATPNDSEGDKS